MPVPGGERYLAQHPPRLLLRAFGGLQRGCWLDGRECGGIATAPDRQTFLGVGIWVRLRLVGLPVPYHVQPFVADICG